MYLHVWKRGTCKKRAGWEVEFPCRPFANEKLSCLKSAVLRQPVRVV